MSEEAPGELIGSGRLADVFELGDGTVLRRYRQDGHDAEREAEVMRWVRERGVPAPRVHRAAGRDIVMDRVDGPTMRAVLQRSPRSSIRCARTLARLQAALAAVPAPDWLMAPGFDASPGEDSVLHLDLHPGNVIMSSSGPVLIDWTDAACGPAGFDAALSYVEMVTYPTDGQVDRIAGRVLSGRFRRARGAGLVDPFVSIACDHRLADPTITPDERTAVAEYRRRVRGGRSG